jgi:two-component system, NarL family, sensor histidine kinase UhpB
MEDTNSSMRHGLVMMASLALGVVALVAAVLWYYVRQREAIRAAATQELAAIARVKASQIANWRSERLGDGRVQAASGTMRIARRILSSRAASAADQAGLLDVMIALSRQFLYTGAALVDRDGKIRVQFAPDHAIPSHIRELAQAAAQAGDVRLEDLYLDTELGRPLMALTIPVHGLGALILEIDPSRFLYPYIASWPVPSASAVSFLGRSEGKNQYLYLSDQGSRRAALVVRETRPLGVVLDPLLGSGILWRGLDYRGVPVLVVVQLVPDSAWFLNVKINTAEVEAPVRRLSLELMLILVLLGATSAAGVGLIWRDQQVRLHHQQEAWFRAVANDTPAYLWMTSNEDPDNHFINVPFRKLIGTDQERVGNWAGYLHPDDAAPARAILLECMGARRDYMGEFRIRRFDGEYRWVTCQGVPRFSPEGEFLGYAGSFMDITDRRQAEQQLRTANAALADEVVEKTRNEAEIQLLSARLMTVQEEERGRLARELHDNLSQQIAALSIATGSLKRHIPQDESEARNQSDRIQQKLVQLAEAVRRMSHELHPAVLEHSGLVSAMQEYCDEFGALTGIRVALSADGSFDRVPAPVALGLFRIMQEALQNIAKHAATQEAQVALGYSDGQLCLTVADRGVGMDLDRANAPAGLGLVSIRERTRLLHGKVDIWSKPNQGTRVVVRVPAGVAEHGASVSANIS